MNSRLESLEQLGRLRDQKVLSEGEFETEKALLLSHGDEVESDPARPSFAKLLQGPNRKRGLIAVAVAVAIGAYFGLTSGLPTNNGKAAPADATSAQATTAAAQPPSLSAILKFDRPDECEAGDELKALFADLRALEPNGAAKSVTAGINGPSFKPDVLRAEQGNAVIARLLASGSLNGLRVTELRTTRFDASDAQVFQVRFAETPERVRSKLNETGFTIPRPSELKTVETDDGHGLVYGVEQVSSGSALTCASL